MVDFVFELAKVREEKVSPEELFREDEEEAGAGGAAAAEAAEESAAGSPEDGSERKE
ncbi:hypothetical protein HRbin39_01169 [bacterium HR39]|nr:hypothetical protein HRbin39_01169 [bacterium HR39]